MRQTELDRNDPDAIIEAWDRLLATGAHLHAPQVAAMLGLSEAALIAARVGSGATRLQPQSNAILAPIAEWGRVLCAFSNLSGVHMPLGHTAIGNGPDGAIRLHGDHMRAAVDGAAIAEAFLFQNRDENHGNSRSLQFFDADGEPVLKVFVFHKARFDAAQEHFGGLVSDNQSRLPAPAETRPRFRPEAASQADDCDTAWLDLPVEDAVRGTLVPTGRCEIEAVGPHARVQWFGEAPPPRFENGMLHFHETGLRSHLRLAQLTSVHRTQAGGISLAGAGGRLLRFRMENR